MFKLIALDLDGTLLKGDNTISIETKKALDIAKNCGSKIVLSTGRPIHGVMKYLKELNLLNDENYVICYNGSIVYNTKTLTPIFKKGLSGKEFKNIYSLSKDLGVEFHGFSEECVVAPKENKYTDGEIEHNNIDVKIIDVLNDISDSDFLVKAMILDDKEKLDNALTSIPSSYYNKFNAVRTVSFIFEFMNRDCSKSKALDFLCSVLNITSKDIIAFGDGGNDIDMLEFAGLGVAMGNASNEVKEKANIVCDTNENNGVAKILSNYF